MRQMTDEMAEFPVAFPGLHTISMAGVTFDDEEGVDLNVFENWLRKRHNHNVGLRKLMLTRCYNIGELGVRNLQRLVDDVEWDGYTRKSDFWYFYRYDTGSVVQNRFTSSTKLLNLDGELISLGH